MSVNATVLLRPRKPSLLRGVVNPDAFDGEVLDDGSILLFIEERFDVLERHPDEARARLTPALVEAHVDPRGFLFFPNIRSPRGRTYEAVVAEVEREGLWVPARVLSSSERTERERSSDEAMAPFLALFERRDRGEPVDHLLEQLLAKRMKEPPEAASVERDADIAAGLAKLITNTVVAGMTEGTLAFLLKRPSRRPFTGPVTLMTSTVASERALWDGTHVVETLSVDAEQLAGILGTTKMVWGDEHDDDRGVPLFRSSALPRIRSATSYDDALRRLGARVTFVRAESLGERRDMQRARLRALLAKPDD